MNLCREDQNKDIQLVVEKGQQVLNVNVKMVSFGLRSLKYILYTAPPTYFSF